MSQQSHFTNGGTVAPSTPPLPGSVIFAGVMLAVTGILGILQGITAIAKDEVYAEVGKYVFKFDLTAWGWIHLLLGILVAAVTWGVFTSATWARITGVCLVSLSVVANFLWLPYAP